MFILVDCIREKGSKVGTKKSRDATLITKRYERKYEAK